MKVEWEAKDIWAGRRVQKSPLTETWIIGYRQTKGARFFHVISLSDGMVTAECGSEQELAEWLNKAGDLPSEVFSERDRIAARSPAPEGAEADPAAGARLAEIARIIEDVDSRCPAADWPNINTRHEMTDDEMRAIYALAKEGPSASPQPDQSELLREAKTALVGMLTFYGMDEDPNEASGVVHTRARAALLSIAECLGDEPPETGRQKAKIREALGDE